MVWRMAWHGMVWHAWNDIVWCSMVWNGMVWYSMVCNVTYVLYVMLSNVTLSTVN